MKNKSLVANIFLSKGKAVCGLKDLRSYSVMDPAELAQRYEKNGADELLVFDLSNSEKEQEQNLSAIRRISRGVDIPVMGGGHINGPEDARHLLQNGCKMVFLNMSKSSNVEMLCELSREIGRERLAVCIHEFTALEDLRERLRECASLVILLGDHRHLYDAVNTTPLPAIPVLTVADYDRVFALLGHKNVTGISGKAVSDLDADLRHLRSEGSKRGIPLLSCVSSFAWEDLKLNSDGLIPVIVQDYRNYQVLMMAYMNKEAFEKTLLTGKMTYYSRSRRQLWLKGETSGHFQQVKQILVDCDNDTLLAKVVQEGAACHTGNRSCFYREALSRQYAEHNISVLSQNMMERMQRQACAQKDRSGASEEKLVRLDVLLKELGAQTTEILLSAKDKNQEKVLAEAGNLFYQAILLMVQMGISWDDITEELSKKVGL